MAITLDGTNGVTTPDLTVDTDTLTVDATNNRVGIGTSSPTQLLDLTGSTGARVAFTNTGTRQWSIGNNSINLTFTDESLSTERMRINNNGHVTIGTTNTNPAGNNVVGTAILSNGNININRNNAVPAVFGRTVDGSLVSFYSGGTAEGNISVSGTTVSYNGGHLARWSQLADNTRDETIVKGTVMSNLDQMAEWTTDGVTEDNEQLNCMKVSDVEGDANVAGVFVNWDDDDDIYTNDMNIAMTGDMVIRIAQGVTVQRGDLLMSAGDGTAKPQGDDIVRSKTIAKVTSTTVSNTYADGSYLVPCVLMAC